MQIKVLETKIAANCPLGIRSKEYKKGEIYDIYDKLADVFIKEGWGEAIESKPKEKMVATKLENKMVATKLENKMDSIFQEAKEDIGEEVKEIKKKKSNRKKGNSEW